MWLGDCMGLPTKLADGKAVPNLFWITRCARIKCQSPDLDSALICSQQQKLRSSGSSGMNWQNTAASTVMSVRGEALGLPEWMPKPCLVWSGQHMGCDLCQSAEETIPSCSGGLCGRLFNSNFNSEGASMHQLFSAILVSHFQHLKFHGSCRLKYGETCTYGTREQPMSLISGEHAH